MSDSKQRKEAPKVTEGIDRDLDELYAQGSTPNSSDSGVKAKPVEPSQREPRPFHEQVDLSKLQFGQKLIWCCIFLIVALSLVGYFFNGADQDREVLRTAIELLKLVTTTALGFVFAKTQMAAQQAKKDNDR